MGRNKIIIVCLISGLLFSALGLTKPLLAQDSSKVLKGKVLYQRGNRKASVEQAIVALVGVADDISPVVKNKPVMDQVNQTFTPHIVYSMVGQKVAFKNSEMIVHNARCKKGGKTLFDQNQYPMGASYYTFKEPGVYRIVCDIHPSMLGFVIVLEKPYLYTKTNQQGEFSFDLSSGIKPGKYKIFGWSEQQSATGSLEIEISNEGLLSEIELILTKQGY